MEFMIPCVESLFVFLARFAPEWQRTTGKLVPLREGINNIVSAMSHAHRRTGMIEPPGLLVFSTNFLRC
jgi:hypothetical protein